MSDLDRVAVQLFRALPADLRAGVLGLAAVLAAEQDEREGREEAPQSYRRCSDRRSYQDK